MKPQRLRLTHNLLLNYKLYRKMTVFSPHMATDEEMSAFHFGEYIDFLKKVSPDNATQSHSLLARYNLGAHTDCPVFDGLYDFCRSYTGGSIDGAVQLNHGQADIAVNFSGGLHHAKKSEASGFCYVNDIVLAILELLKFHARVLYIDIDIHHGDGVEEAFYTTDRVLTCSFHKFGDFFPGTGDHSDIGHKAGRNYSVNFPLESGIKDDDYQRVFKPVIRRIIELYRPGAVVLQCGADSLTGDRLGCFNLTLKGHGECVSFVKSFGLPTLILGGGGYKKSNVARCWAYETSLVLDSPISGMIPYNEFFDYFGPTFQLHLTPATDMPNHNTKEYLNTMMEIVMQNIDQLQHAPSAQIQDVPASVKILKKGRAAGSGSATVDEDDDAELDVSEGTKKSRDDAILGGPEHEGEMYD